MPDFLAPFTALGQALETAFRRAHYSEAAFSELAVEHVERARLHEGFALSALGRWALSTTELPRQHDSAGDFGDPPITLWRGRRFFVSALVWRSSATTLHQHNFTGAFQVLQGSSVHTRYTFETRREVSEDLKLGTLSCTSIERLERGAVRQIPAAGAGTHALFHLDHPSVSLVVRTLDDARHPIQYDYHPPGLAVWTLRGEAEQRRACQIARMLVEVAPDQAAELVAELLPSLPACDGYALLGELLESGDLALCLGALTTARPQLDAELASAFEAALVARDCTNYLMRRRSAVREPNARYLLAILLNAPTRVHALALAEAHTPGRPGAETLVEWLRELSQIAIKVQVGGQAWEPNVLGLPAADEASCAALRAALAGESGAPAGSLPFYEAVRHGRAFAPLFRS